MAEGQNDILDMSMDDGVYIYDPRARYKRRSRRMYDPRRRRSSRRRARHDPQIRRYISMRRPTRKSAGSFLNQLTTKKGGLLWGVVGGLIAINGGLSTALYSRTDISWKDKLQAFFIGVPVQRLTGSPSGQPSSTSGILPRQGVTWNPNKALNNVTYTGIGLIAYGLFGKHFKLPHTSKALNVGIPLAIGGIVGGGFDPAVGGTGPGARTPGPQITRPTSGPVGPRASYLVGNAPVPTQLSGGLQA